MTCDKMCAISDLPITEGGDAKFVPLILSFTVSSVC